MSGCVFCQIASGEIPVKLLYQDSQAVAFHDASPQAPVHVLVVPRAHAASIIDMHDEAAIGHLLSVAKIVAKQLDLTDFRLVINTGAQAGQSVWHVHLHILGGRAMQWPPG